MSSYTRAVKNSYVPFRRYMEGGNTAMEQMMAQMGLSDQRAFDVTTLPGYQQSMNQAISAVNQGAASEGMLHSGERLKSLQQAGQSVFGNYYENYMNRLMGLSQQGLGAASSAQNTLTNNLNALTARKSAEEGGGGGSPMGDIMGAAASMFGTYMGSS